MNVWEKDLTIFAIPLSYSKIQQHPTERKLSVECKICYFANGKSISFNFAYYDILQESFNISLGLYH